MIAEFSIWPIGEGASTSEHVAKVLKLVDESDLPYKLNSMGTVVEGDYDKVMELIGRCHRLLADRRRLAVHEYHVAMCSISGNAVERKLPSVCNRVQLQRSRTPTRERTMPTVHRRFAHGVEAPAFAGPDASAVRRKWWARC